MFNRGFGIRSASSAASSAFLFSFAFFSPKVMPLPWFDQSPSAEQINNVSLRIKSK
jgi:hypothetical protein